MKRIIIKNMVCARCIKSVTNIFFSNGAEIREVQLGVVELKKPLTGKQEVKIKSDLLAEGFEIVNDQKSKLVQQVKQLIIDLVHYKDLAELNENLSDYLSGCLHRDYNYLSNLFSSVEGMTIEHFFIMQKLEKVKEWLAYGELSLSEMAFRLNYSSVAHLSGQFRNYTGFTASQFKKLKEHPRKHIDKMRP